MSDNQQPTSEQSIDKNALAVALHELFSIEENRRSYAKMFFEEAVSVMNEYNKRVNSMNTVVPTDEPYATSIRCTLEWPDGTEESARVAFDVQKDGEWGPVTDMSEEMAGKLSATMKQLLEAPGDVKYLTVRGVIEKTLSDAASAYFEKAQAVDAAN